MKVVLAIAIVVTGTPLYAAAAQSTTNPSIVVTATPTASPPRLICRRVSALTGSHVSRVRTCRTAAQWRAMSDSSVDDAMDSLSVLSQAQGGYPGGVTPAGARPR